MNTANYQQDGKGKPVGRRCGGLGCMGHGAIGSLALLVIVGE